MLKERGITSEGVEANSTFISDIADLFVDSDYDALKDVCFDCCVRHQGQFRLLLVDLFRFLRVTCPCLGRSQGAGSLGGATCPVSEPFAARARGPDEGPSGRTRPRRARADSRFT